MKLDETYLRAFFVWISNEGFKYIVFLALFLTLPSLDIKCRDPIVTENPTTYHAIISIIPMYSMFYGENIWY